MQPAPFPLVFRYLVGWANPVELDYTTGLTTAKVGQLSLRRRRPAGIKINLPDQVIDTPNPLGTGKAWCPTGRPGGLLPGPRLRPDDRRGADLLVRELLELRAGLRLRLRRGLHR